MRSLLIFCLCSFATYTLAQDNPFFSNPVMSSVLAGDFDPADYNDPAALKDPKVILSDVIQSISTDSLEYYLQELNQFGNRNSGSDTLSETFGIGAAREYILDELSKISRRTGGDLITGYYQFDRDICGVFRHKNVLALLPGIGQNAREFIIVEAHYDSRCEDRCGIECLAEGADDNGSGTALVMELARVMSHYRFDRSIVFMLTTGEEQGLVGARSFAEYVRDQDIDLKAVFNNDVVGGIICGETASPPGCPGLNAIDSINLRVYSAGSNGSINKGLARFAKMEYEEEIAPLMSVPSQVRLMSAEDRTGRGGDHIPFRELGYPAIRFTEANEHGNGNPSTPDYSDRQHSTRDVIGEDTDGDGVIDEYFVDFNYLKKNSLVNATAIIASAAGPGTPQLVFLKEIPGGISIEIGDPDPAPAYKIGIRRLTSGPEFDTVVTITSTRDSIMGFPRSLYYVSVAAIDSLEIESLFTQEERLSVPSGINDPVDNPVKNDWELMQNNPNPFDEATWIRIRRHRVRDYRSIFLSVTDMEGKELARIPVQVNGPETEILYDYQYHGYQPGVYAYSLVVDGVVVDTKRMIYAY